MKSSENLFSFEFIGKLISLYPPENIGKPLVFWSFQGEYKLINSLKHVLF